jgi:hypothetical protein
MLLLLKQKKSNALTEINTRGGNKKMKKNL